MMNNKVFLKRNNKRFGKLQINITELYKNKLMIAYISGSPFQKIKTKKITDDLSGLLIDIIETEGKNEINEDTLGRLSSEERDIFNTIIDYSGLRSFLKLKDKPRTINQCIARFQVLQGSIEAGNDNKEVLKEAIELLKILVLANKIDKEEADSIIESLNEEIK